MKLFCGNWLKSGNKRSIINKKFYDLQKNILEQGIIPVPISVNVSRQLLYDKYFADFYCNYMKQMEIPTNLVELEITESAFFEDIELERTYINTTSTYKLKLDAKENIIIGFKYLW